MTASALIDTGSSESFINPSMVQSGIPVTPGRGKVAMASISVFSEI